MAGTVNFSLRRQLRRAERALALCRVHPDDPAVLLTDRRTGVVAGYDPHFKAVILETAIPPEQLIPLQEALIESCQKETQAASYKEQIASRLTRNANACFKDSNAERMNALPPALAKVVTDLHKTFHQTSGDEEVTGQFYMGRGAANKASRIHYDSTVWTGHLSIDGPGLEWFPGMMTIELYRSLRSVFHSSQYPSGLKSEITANGQAVFFKGTGSNYRIDHELYVPGLIHRTPDPEDRTIYIAAYDTRKFSNISMPA